MVRLVQNSFFGGQLDFEMMGRQDYQRYAKGATKLCNFNVMKRGGLDKRRGFDRVMNLTEELAEYGVTAGTKFRAIPFAYQKSHGFVLLLSGPKCIVVGTSPQVQFRYYEVTGLDGVYSASEIDEIDYQQCGDTLFLAHQNHHPAKIEHVINSGVHGFHYYDVDIGARKSGIPSITGAVLTRLRVKGNGAASVVVESYKASAVFDGVETLPCSAYSHNNPGHVDPEDTDAYDGTRFLSTAYRAPWTESQKINLEITANKGIDREGNAVLPDRINIYKKAFNYYGLIGVVDVKDSLTIASSLLFKSKSGNTNVTFTELKNSDSTATNGLAVTTEEGVAAITAHANGRVAFVWPKDQSGNNAQIALNMNSASTYNSGTTRVRVYVGSVYYTIDGDSVTFTYTGTPKSYIRIAPADLSSDNYTESGDYTYVSIPDSEGRTVTAEKNSDESAEAFEARWMEEYDNFVASLNGVEYLDVQYSNSGKKYALITVLDENKSPLSDDFAVGAIVAYTVKDTTKVYFDDTYITPDSSITPIEETAG